MYDADKQTDLNLSKICLSKSIMWQEWTGFIQIQAVWAAYTLSLGMAYLKFQSDLDGFKSAQKMKLVLITIHCNLLNWIRKNKIKSCIDH